MEQLASDKMLKLAEEYANKWDCDDGVKRIIIRAYVEGYLRGTKDYNSMLEPIIEEIKSYTIKKVGEYKTKTNNDTKNKSRH